MFLFIRNESFESSNVNFSSNPQNIDNHIHCINSKLE